MVKKRLIGGRSEEDMKEELLMLKTDEINRIEGVLAQAKAGRAGLQQEIKDEEGLLGVGFMGLGGGKRTKKRTKKMTKRRRTTKRRKPRTRKRTTKKRKPRTRKRTTKRRR